jgi:hypothetical protein
MIGGEPVLKKDFTGYLMPTPIDRAKRNRENEPRGWMGGAVEG